MITFVNSTENWPRRNRFNESTFVDGKPTIVFSMSKSHPAFKPVVDLLNTFKKTQVYCFQPRDFKRILKERDEYVNPPCIIGYDHGECVFRYSTDSIRGNEPVDLSLDDVSFELSKLFI